MNNITMAVFVDDFTQEVKCEYKGELYSVRDNGAVFRHPQPGKRKRKIDDQWTFGKPNANNGYMEIASVRVHRIVATAFHGEPPTKDHVIVDHIDTNKHNNRPENLRWVTRFENVILNPITVKRIESVCQCNIEEFLENPQDYRDLLANAPKDISWMRTVSQEEAMACKENLTKWAKSDKPLLRKTLGDWVYRRNEAPEEKVEEIFKKVEKRTGISRDELCFNKTMRGNFYEARKYATKQLRSELNLSDSLIGKLIGISTTTVSSYLEVSADRYSGDYKEVSDKQYKRFSEASEIIPSNVVQFNWGTESQFPSVPNKVLNDPISEYGSQLKENAIFFQNPFYSTKVLESKILDVESCLLVLYEVIKKDGSDTRWGIMKVTFEEEKFVHEIILNYNGTLEHYWLIDAENHFKAIIEGVDWIPLYDSQGREFKGDYMPL